MSFSQFFELMLEADSEKRKDYLEKKYNSKLEERLQEILPKDQFQSSSDKFRAIFGYSTIDFVIKNIDPTEGIYSEWIIRTLLNIGLKGSRLNRFFVEDWYKVNENLKKYHQHKNLFKKIAKEKNDQSIAKLTDINTIKSFLDLTRSLHLLESDVEDVNQKKLVQGLEKQVEKIYNSENYLILIPKTREASCAYGRNTRWCTAAKEVEHNRFDDYSRRGPLYIVIDKIANEKYQFHFQDKQYADENDEQLDTDWFFEQHPEIKEIILKLAAENDDLYLLVKYKSEYTKEAIKNMSENKLAAAIRNYLVVALGLIDSHPDLVNKSQKLFQIENESSVTLKTTFTDWVDFSDFIRGQVERRQTIDILNLTNDLDFYEAPFGEEDLIKLRDIINADNLDLISKYVKQNYDVDSDDSEELFSILQDNDDSKISYFIYQAVQDTYTSSYRDALYERAKKSVVEAVPGSVIKNGENIEFKSVRVFFLKSLAVDLDRMQSEGLEDPTPSDWDTFFPIWIEKLRSENDLVSVNYNDVEPNFSNRIFNNLLNEAILRELSFQKENSNPFSINRVSNNMNQFDQYIRKLWQEGLGTMGQGGLTNRGPAVTQTNSSTSTTVNRPATTTNQNNSQNHTELDVGAYFKNNSTDWDREMRMPEFQNAIAAHYDKVMLDPKTPSNEKNDLITKIQKTPALQKYFQDKTNKEMNPAQMQQGGMVR